MTATVATSVNASSRVWMSYSIMKLCESVFQKSERGVVGRVRGKSETHSSE